MAKILDKPLDNVSVQGNGVVTKNELRAILKNISVQVPDAQSNSNLEVFEVLELKTDAETKQQEVVGRYVYSQHGDIEVNNYKPCNSNIIQYPMVGELWLGLSYKDENYYLARLSDTDISVNYQKLGESEKVISPGVDNTDVKTPKESILSRLFGTIKKDINPTAKAFEEGSTLIQGRFNNYINLGSDDDSRGIININNFDAATIDIGIKEQVTFSGIGGEIFPQSQESATITMDADRIELNARNTGIEISSLDSILIDSDEGDLILEAADRIRLRPRNSIIDLDIKNGGTLLTRTKDGFPFGQLDMIGFLKQVTGIQKIFQALIIGIPKLSSPATLPSGVKDIVKGLKGAQQFVDATINLEFLSQYIMETKTIEEIKAVLPIPAGFGGIIDDIANITDEQIKKLEELEKSVGEQIQKASELQSTLSQSPPDVGSVKNLIDDGSFDSFDGVADLRSVLGDNPSDEDLERYISNGGLSSFENQVSDLNSVVGSADTARSYKNLFKAARS